MRHFQNFGDVAGNVAEFEVAVSLACARESADYSAEAAAVDERDFAQVQDDGAAVVQEPCNVRTQRFTLTAGDDAPVAAYDRDASDLASIEGKAQWGSDAGGGPAKSPHYIREGGKRILRSGAPSPLQIGKDVCEERVELGSTGPREWLSPHASSVLRRSGATKRLT